MFTTKKLTIRSTKYASTKDAIIFVLICLDYITALKKPHGNICIYMYTLINYQKHVNYF